MVGIISSGNFLTFLGENEKVIVFSPAFFFSLVLRAPCNQSCYTLVSLIFVNLLFFLVFDFNDVFLSI